MLKATTELFSAPKAGPIVRGRIPTPLLEEVLRGPAAGQTDRSPEGVGAGAAEEAGPSNRRTAMGTASGKDANTGPDLRPRSSFKHCALLAGKAGRF